MLLLAEGRDSLLEAFDYWREPSADLRQYLWAHHPEDVEKARMLVELLPAEAIFRILRYLVGSYWARYVGWPDLIAHKSDSFLFAEVKSSKDKLSEDQKEWIRGNTAGLHLPFSLVKIHKQGTRQAPDD